MSHDITLPAMRQRGQLRTGALDEQAGVENREQQRQRPQRGRCDRSRRQIEQQEEAGEQHEPGAPCRLSGRRVRRATIGTASDTTPKIGEDRHRRPQGLERQVTSPPRPPASRSQRTRRCNRGSLRQTRSRATRTPGQEPAACRTATTARRTPARSPRARRTPRAATARHTRAGPFPVVERTRRTERATSGARDRAARMPP